MLFPSPVSTALHRLGLGQPFRVACLCWLAPPDARPRLSAELLELLPAGPHQIALALHLLFFAQFHLTRFSPTTTQDSF